MHLAETKWRLDAVQQLAGMTSINFWKNMDLSDRLIGSHAFGWMMMKLRLYLPLE